MVAVATYGMSCAAAIAAMGFFGLFSPMEYLPAGEVVVEAPKGVEEHL